MYLARFILAVTCRLRLSLVRWGIRKKRVKTRHLLPRQLHLVFETVCLEPSWMDWFPNTHTPWNNVRRNNNPVESYRIESQMEQNCTYPLFDRSFRIVLRLVSISPSFHSVECTDPRVLEFGCGFDSTYLYSMIYDPASISKPQCVSE